MFGLFIYFFFESPWISDQVKHTNKYATDAAL